MIRLAIPNLISFGRLACVPLTVWLMLEGRMEAAFWLFVAAGVTDALDGFLARMLDARTALGALIDPLADKALLVGTYGALGWSGHLPLWLVGLVVARDILILAGAALLWRMGRRSLRPLFVSKVNTVAQILLPALVLAHLGLEFDELGFKDAAIWLVAVTTIYSGAAYVMLSFRESFGVKGRGVGS